MSTFGGKADISRAFPQCLLLTQSGYRGRVLAVMQTARCFQKYGPEYVGDKTANHEYIEARGLPN